MPVDRPAPSFVDAMLGWARQELSAEAKRRFDYLGGEAKATIRHDTHRYLSWHPRAAWVPEDFGEYVEWLEQQVTRP